MAFAATNLTAEPRAFSIGPMKMQIMTYTVASADTSGTVTADSLSSIDAVIVTGPAGVFTTQASYSGNVATLAFVDPAATRQGVIICFGS